MGIRLAKAMGVTEYYHNYVRTAYRMLTQSFQKVVTDEMSNEKLMFLENR